MILFLNVFFKRTLKVLYLVPAFPKHDRGSVWTLAPPPKSPLTLLNPPFFLLLHARLSYTCTLHQYFWVLVLLWALASLHWCCDCSNSCWLDSLHCSQDRQVLSGFIAARPLFWECDKSRRAVQEKGFPKIKSTLKSCTVHNTCFFMGQNDFTQTQ